MNRTRLGSVPTYGSYTAGQLRFIHERISKDGRSAKSFLDPMCGSGNLIAQLGNSGCQVTGWDINPAVLAIANIRTEVPGYTSEAIRDLRQLVLEIGACHQGETDEGFESDWLPRATAHGLAELGQLVGVYGHGHNWSRTFMNTMMLGAAIVSAREIAAFRRTKNATWVKPGGLPKAHNWSQALLDAIETITTAWLPLNGREPPTFERRSALPVTEGLDTSLWRFVATSPPYPNRLNYEVMWGPELAVYEAMTSDIANLNSEAMGSNSVAGASIPIEWQESLPDMLVEPLTQIQQSTAKASATYYLPYFLKYCLELRSLLGSMIKRVASPGFITIFVRDVVRKDVLLPIGDYVSYYMREAGATLIDTQRIVVRNHIGLRRPKAHGVVYGDAQIEWSLSFAY